MKSQCQQVKDADLVALGSDDDQLANEVKRHVVDCSDCTQRVAEYRRLATALGNLREDVRRPERAVQDALHHEPPTVARRWRRPLVVSSAIAMAAAIALLVLSSNKHDSHGAGNISLRITVERSGAVMRGEELHIGDTLTAELSQRSATIWIYFNGRLQRSCPPSCDERQDVRAVTITIARPGRYQLVSIELGTNRPAPTSLPQAIEQATNRGELHQLQEFVAQ